MSSTSSEQTARSWRSRQVLPCSRRWSGGAVGCQLALIQQGSGFPCICQRRAIETHPSRSFRHTPFALTGLQVHDYHTNTMMHNAEGTPRNTRTRCPSTFVYGSRCQVRTKTSSGQECRFGHSLRWDRLMDCRAYPAGPSQAQPPFSDTRPPAQRTQHYLVLTFGSRNRCLQCVQ